MTKVTVKKSGPFSETKCLKGFKWWGLTGKENDIMAGTYNPQDPTHYEKIHVQFLIQQETGYEPFDVEINDVTWVLDISFSENGKGLAKGTWDPQSKSFINVELEDGEAFFDLLLSVMVNAVHATDLEDDYTDEMGCLANYE